MNSTTLSLYQPLREFYIQLQREAGYGSFIGGGVEQRIDHVATSIVNLVTEGDMNHEEAVAAVAGFLFSTLGNWHDALDYADAAIDMSELFDSEILEAN